MGYIYSILTRRPYLALATTSLLVIAEMALALVDLVPIEHEWVLGWLLFLTVLTWVYMAIRIGVKAPISHRAMKYAYRILATSLLVILAAIGLALVFRITNESSFILIFMLNPLMWLGASGLVGAIAPPNNSAKSYLILVVLPLFAAASVGFLSAGLIAWIFWPVALLSCWLGVSLLIGIVAFRTVLSAKPRTPKLYIVVALCALVIPWVGLALFYAGLIFAGLIFPSTSVSLGFVVVLVFLTLLAAGAVFKLLAILIGTIRYPYRNIVVSGLWLWVMIVGIGWYWVETMENGVDAFTGEERVAADQALYRYRTHCGNRVSPGYRVVKDDNGRFIVKYYTWWRIPISCYLLPRGID